MTSSTTDTKIILMYKEILTGLEVFNPSQEKLPPCSRTMSMILTDRDRHTESAAGIGVVAIGITDLLPHVRKET
jgi:hypothetical protein